MAQNYYQDEEILNVKKEQEVYQSYLEKKALQSARIDSIKKGVLEIQGKEIILEKVSFFDNAFTMLIPNIFERKETKGDHYLYSIASNDVHIILSSSDDSIIPMALKEYKKKLIENMYTEAKVNIEWIEEGLHIERELKITYVAFTIPVEDSAVYNYAFFFGINQKTYIISCSCMEYKMDDWMILGKGLIETIKVVR